MTDSNPFMDKPIHHYLGINTTEYFNRTEFDFGGLLFLGSYMRLAFRNLVESHHEYKFYKKIYNEERKKEEYREREWKKAFTKPNKDNVDLGDFLVAEDSFHVPVLGIITDIGEEKITARSTLISLSIPYKTAVVLKKNGSYLVGENIPYR